MQRCKKGFESGRSMVEILAVLAMTGVLAIGGIVGYGYAVRLYRDAETLDALSVTIAGARTWDIPLHYGAKTVGLGDDYVPYVVPIREVVSKVAYRTAMSSYDAGLVDDEGTLVSGTTMYDVREYESFTSALGAPVWVRAEDDETWSVRITGISYDMCEKILHKKDLGFTHAYVALKDASDNPVDTLAPDFDRVDNTEKYMNPSQFPEDEQDANMVANDRISQICEELDPSKGSIAPALIYVQNIDNPEIVSASGPGCEDKKSVRCMAYSARISNPDTGEVNAPLHTLVLRYGKTGTLITPPPSMCRPGTPFTEESGGTIMTEECCLDLGDTYFREDLPECCILAENEAYQPRCVIRPDGFYAIDIDCARDSSGDCIEPMVAVEVERLIDETVTSDGAVYVSRSKWDGTDETNCCDAFIYPPNPDRCHMSSVPPVGKSFSKVLPWPVKEEMGLTNTQYKNCPHGGPTTTYDMSEKCCQDAGDYWAVTTNGRRGVDTKDTSLGQARCCATDSVISYVMPTSLDQCPWQRNTNTGATTTAGSVPKDIYGQTTTECCYKDPVRGKMKETPCAYEAGLLKYSKECCETSVANNVTQQPMKYIYAPYPSARPSRYSRGCGLQLGEKNTVESDRNCCVDYASVKTAPGPKDNILDWTGRNAPEYCCDTLIGTPNGATKEEVKNYYKECCEAELFTNTFRVTGANLHLEGEFVEAGTLIRNYSITTPCPTSYATGDTCVFAGPAYKASENQCCDLSTGKTMAGSESEICCNYASMTNKKAIYWDGGACVTCPTCSVIPPPPGPIPTPCLECCYDPVLPPDPDPIQEKRCVAPCFLANTECCQGKGMLWDGSFSCSCCDENKIEGDDGGLSNSYSSDSKACFKPKSFVAGTPNSSCWQTVTSPPPGVPTLIMNCAPVICPAGVAVGTVIDKGECP